MDGKPYDEVIRETLEAVKQGMERGLERLRPEETGLVISSGEGIVNVDGLPNVRAEELLRFPGGVMGMAYNLDEKRVGVILLDEGGGLEAGDEAYRTGRVLDVPVGEALLGRVTDPLGRPLDNGGPVHTTERLPAERPAPPIMHRAPVQTPLQTGLKVIDALIPIGRGQRELILGDRQTGKTALAVDTILNQRDSGVICIYCGIGKQKAAVARVAEELRARDAMEYSLVVSAESDAPAGIQFIAPYAATSMGEYFMRQGRDVLIVYDDLTWHARAYRQLALLLRRPPGREAYPGDIFYIHARLLERSTQLKKEYGGGSLTAFPIIETQSQDISAFIPTNLISITDGQIYLSPKLFQKDILPAVDIGLSVSRVGDKAQLPHYRFAARNLKLSYMQFQELEAFSRFSSRLDEESRSRIDRGERIREILKQRQYSPLPVTEQIVQLLAVSSGLADETDPSKFHLLKREIGKRVGEGLSDIARKIDGGEELDEQDRGELLAVARKAVEAVR